jgi:hypothetical protein
MRHAVCSVAVGLALGAAIAAAGSVSAIADPHAEAVVLFDQGIQDMKAGRLDKACAELQASLDLVKDSGTRGALARCHGLSGRIATAWLLWRGLSDTAPTRALRADAAAQARKLEPRLPRYTIRLAGPTPALLIEVNGHHVAAPTSVAVPIDPGKVSVRASGRDGDRVVTEIWTHDYTAVEGQVLTIEVPGLVALPASPAPAAGRPGAMPVIAATRTVPDDATARTARGRTRRVAALALGGVTLGVAAAGVVFGLDARAKYADARRACGGVIDQCDPDQVGASQHLVDRARSSATLSSVLFGVAGATAVTAVVVWFTAPSPGAEAKAVVIAPTAAPGSFGVALSGAF